MIRSNKTVGDVLSEINFKKCNKTFNQLKIYSSNRFVFLTNKLSLSQIKYAVLINFLHIYLYSSDKNQKTQFYVLNLVKQLLDTTPHHDGMTYRNICNCNTFSRNVSVFQECSECSLNVP